MRVSYRQPEDAVVERIQPFGGLEDKPEDVVRVTGPQTVEFTSKTSVSIRGSLGGYVKVGDALAGNPHKPQPNFEFKATWEELAASDGKSIEIRGGGGLFVRVEAVPDIELPRRVKGTFSLPAEPGKARSVYSVGRKWSGAKVVTSPLFINYV